MKNAQPGAATGLDSNFDSLVLAHKAFTSDSESIFLARDLEDALLRTTEWVNKDTDIEQVKVIIQYWLEYYARAIEIDKHTTSTTHMSFMSGMFNIILQHNLVKPLIALPESRALLAWACVTCTAGYEKWSYNIAKAQVGQVLSLWTEQPDVEKATKHTAEIVNLIYGPGVWELYATDAESALLVPSHLYKLGLPAVGPGAKMITNQANTEKPNTEMHLPGTML